MIVIATEQADLTADLVIDELDRLDVEFCRLNSDRLLLDATLEIEDGIPICTDEASNRFDLSKASSVWYRRPTPPRPLSTEDADFCVRESWATFMGAMLSLQPRLWVNHPNANFTANQKPLQLGIAKKFGLAVPRTMITRSAVKAREFISATGPCIVKPVTYGIINECGGEKAIYTTSITLDDIDEHSTAMAPAIFQEHIIKKADLRVTIVGSQIFTVRIHSQDCADARTDWRRGDVTYSQCDLPATIGAALLGFCHELRLEFAAIDLVEAVSGDLYFLEVNPNGQWGWLDLEAGTRIARALAVYLASATGHDAST